MNLEQYCSYCLSLPGVTESFPFNPSTLVFKVLDKMFALSDIDNFKSINLKCNPELAVELRERYSAVQPGYHMNKAHWNTVTIDGSIPNKILQEWILNSYNLVLNSIPKNKRIAAGLYTTQP